MIFSQNLWIKINFTKFRKKLCLLNVHDIWYDWICYYLHVSWCFNYVLTLRFESHIIMIQILFQLKSFIFKNTFKIRISFLKIRLWFLQNHSYFKNQNSFMLSLSKTIFVPLPFSLQIQLIEWQLSTRMPNSHLY